MIESLCLMALAAIMSEVLSNYFKLSKIESLGMMLILMGGVGLIGVYFLEVKLFGLEGGLTLRVIENPVNACLAVIVLGAGLLGLSLSLRERENKP